MAAETGVNIYRNLLLPEEEQSIRFATFFALSAGSRLAIRYYEFNLTSLQIALYHP